MKATPREVGYYWVKLKNHGGQWKIAEYTGAYLWYIPGNENEFYEEDFTEIGPRITPPAN